MPAYVLDALDTTTSVSVEMMLSWEDARAARLVVHDLLGSPTPDVTLREASTRTGTLEFLALDSVSARACADLLSSGRILLAVDAAAPEFSTVRFVVTGDVITTLDQQTRRRWTVSAPYRELPQ